MQSCSVSLFSGPFTPIPGAEFLFQRFLPAGNALALPQRMTLTGSGLPACLTGLPSGLQEPEPITSPNSFLSGPLAFASRLRAPLLVTHAALALLSHSVAFSAPVESHVWFTYPALV